MKCIQCGKKIAENTAVLCQECFAKKNTCFDSYQEHTLLLCPHCGSFKYNKEWKKKKTKQEAIQEAVLSYCHFHHQPNALDIEILEKTKEAKKEKGILILRTETTVDEQPLLEEFSLPYTLKFVSCDQCTKLTTSYFEGILQLRGANNSLFQKVHAFILADATVVKEKGVAISKVEEVKNGIDYYYTRQQYLPNITQKLIDQFGAVGKTHPELYTKNRQTSKDVYRVNASVRLPDFDVGCIVQYNKLIVRITRLGRQILGEDLRTGKRVLLDERENIQVLAEQNDYKTVDVIHWHPHLAILHPLTFQSVPIENQKKSLERKKHVVVVFIDDKPWLIDA